MEPLSFLKSSRENTLLKHYDDDRQEDYFNREYLIRRSVIPVPQLLVTSLAPIFDTASQAISREQSERRPKLKIPSAGLAVTWLKSWVGHDSTHLCCKCSRIDFHAIFKNSTAFEPFTLSYPSIDRPTQSRLCCFCAILQQVTSTLAKDPVPWAIYGPGDWTLDIAKEELVLYHGATRRGQFRLDGDHAPVSYQDQAGIKTSMVTATVVEEHPRQKLNVERARQWLRHCEKGHGAACRDIWSGSRYAEPIDLILIDVRQRRLVRSRSNERYVALSYVWGQAKSLTTTMALLEMLQKPQGLSLAEPLISNVVKDAMHLVEEMGETYLWTDTLCIVQDDSVGKMDAIGRMDVVFGHALLTIVAASGHHADEGLPGVGSAPRTLLRQTWTINRIPLIWRSAELSQVLRYSPYELRAWTLQERLLSRRCLYVSQHQAYFHCPSGYECEDYHDVEFQPKNEERGESLPFQENPLFTLQQRAVNNSKTDVRIWADLMYIYGDLVKVYTPRLLSFPSDIVNAFSGILGVFRDACNGDFVSALPEDCFDKALLWSPQRDCGLKRRQEGNFPSWSWTGWVGTVHYRNHCSVHVFGDVPEGLSLPPNHGKFMDMRHHLIRHLSPEELYACRHYPIKFRAEVGSYIIRIDGRMSKIQRRVAGILYDTIPDARETASVDALPSPCAELPPEHLSFPTIALVDLFKPPPLLYFRAHTVQTTNLKTRAAGQKDFQSPGQINVYHKSLKCGVLFECFSRFTGLRTRMADDGTLRIRELILLSKSPGCADPAYTTRFDERLGAKGWFICHVLLIEWKQHGLWAERIASGTIHVDVWNEQEGEVKDIVLG